MSRDVGFNPFDLHSGNDAEAVPPAARLEFRETTTSAKESSIGFIQSLEGAALFRQGLELVDVCDATSSFSIAVDPFLQSRVVKAPLCRQRPRQPAPIAPLLREQPVDKLAMSDRVRQCGCRPTGI